MKWEEFTKEEQEELEWLFHGWSGKFGNRVFYQRKDVTRHRKAPGSNNKIPTAKQAPCRKLFDEAVQFAKTVIHNPTLKAQFKAMAVPPGNAWSTAISFYMREKNNSKNLFPKAPVHCTPCTWQ